ncbi:hypothetical protein MNBD_GAMMA09-1290 [hydrothermal vent metagenome]|uniref:Uncharacterized protein n=1 Tax=hydrothermal vent metagenome TaxID=652676 RepID=A0A3B0XQG6_9ZZZZ
MNDKEYSVICKKFQEGAEGFDGIDRLIFKASVGQLNSKDVAKTVQATKDKIQEYDSLIASLDETRSQSFVGSYAHSVRSWREHLFTVENPGVDNPFIAEKIMEPEISLHEYKKIFSTFSDLLCGNIVSDLEDIEDGDITDVGEINCVIDAATHVLVEYQRIHELPLHVKLIEDFEKCNSRDVEYMKKLVETAKNCLIDR